MFKQRLIMTLILIPLVLLGIYYLPNLYFQGLIYLLLGVMIFEWQQFITLPRYNLPWVRFGLLSLGVILVMHYWTFFIWLDVIFWAAAVFWIIRYPQHQAHWGSSGFMSLNAWILLGVFGAIMIDLQADSYGKNEMVAVLFLVWAADIGAYLVGRRLGQHKMIPQVSPGKSWEGLMGGILLACLIGALEIDFLQPFSMFWWFVMVVLTVSISVFGDLWMSVLKRHSKLKDTGHLIPGHGGILDRLDSILAALPVFYLGMHWLSGN
jgi:phosphatidate cytidylyltransferase